MKQRDISLDLLRALSMCGIVGLHVLGQGGILGALSSGNSIIKFMLGYGMESLFLCSVNIFAIISGYFYGTRSFDGFKNRNIVDLILTVLFYCLLITVIFVLFQPVTEIRLGMKDILYSISPPIAGRYWYITNYVLLFFLMPYLNCLIQAISKKRFHSLLVVLIFFGSIITTLGYRDFFVFSRGYSMIWLAVCYLLGAYIRNNGVPPFRLGLKKSKSLAVIVINTVLVALSVFFIHHFNLPLNPEWFLQYNSPFIVINSILLFGLFKQNEIINRNANQKVVSLFSAAAFDVYIIHCHIMIYDNLIKDAFAVFAGYHELIMIAAIIMTILMIYIICMLISKIRMWLFRVTGVTRLIDAIGKALDYRLLVN